MNKASTLQATPRQDEDYETAVDRYIIEIEHMRRDMAASQLRIERLRNETSGMLDETRNILNKSAVA